MLQGMANGVQQRVAGHESNTHVTVVPPQQSGKDRTAMSVTHEQARVLHRQHHVGARGEEDINKVANVMREHGR